MTSIAAMTSFDTSNDPTPRARKRQKLDHENNYGGRVGRFCVPGTLSPEDYTVGWVCALPTEMAAARAMLDAAHETIPVCDNDTNTYTLGIIGVHNVVIACLPSDHYGTNNAATVANNMRRSFPSVCIRLMVGIGGGVPGKADIRLGDVVVSQRVIQYDFGKIVAGGHLRRTGVENRPPQRLLTAISKLRADHELMPSQIPSILSKMLEQHPTMAEYTHPGTLQDRLFDGDYDHVQPTDDCNHCDTSRLVNRPARDDTNPKIHYGVIASGNQVMKDGHTRDRLAQELDVLCFEMEAAGLMDSFPCLVIRGICDYSDSHKNKKWQQYAAATAAAYAKELLLVVPTIGGERTLTAAVPSPDLDRQKCLMKSLKFERIDARRSGIRANYAETCKWLLAHPDYLDWTNPEKSGEHHGFLWIKGNPGAGKSTIMNFASVQAEKDKANTVISFFFNARGDSLERSTTGMYRSLLFQLLNALPSLLEIFDGTEHRNKLDDLYKAIRGQDRHPDWKVSLLQDLLRMSVDKLDQERLILFIDALDECDEKQVEEMVEYFEGLGQYATSSGKRLLICFSSRHYPRIDIQFGRKLTLELEGGHGKDVAAYIQSKLKIGKSKTAEDIRTKLRIKAKGIFMWVVLVVNILNQEYKDGRIFEVRKRLNEIPTELGDLFKEILGRDQKNLQDLQLCVQWILFAKRPLKLEEYYFAVLSGLTPRDLSEWEQEEVTRENMRNFVLSSSKGLAETTKATRFEDSTVQFIHESVREFFLKDGLSEMWPNLTATEFEIMSHNRLRQCCYAYMMLDISNYMLDNVPFPEMRHEARVLLNVLLNKFPFLEYATSHILYHAEATADGYAMDKFLEGFPLEAWIHRRNIFDIYGFGRYTPAASLLYILADNNFPRLIKTALRLDPRIDILGEWYRYPFFAALAHGHQDAMKALLRIETTNAQDDIFAHLKDRLVYPADWDHHTPLTWAAENGYGLIVKLMLENGADINMIVENRALLKRIILSGNESVVRVLVEEGADMNNANDRTLLSLAAKKEKELAVRHLFDNGTDLNARDEHGRTPLFWAAKGGQESIAKLLLEKGANVNVKDEFNRTPLSWAAQTGQESVVKLLLEKGANVNVEDAYDRTPLLWALQERQEPAVKLLLEKGANVNSKDRLNQTPLSCAAQMGQESIVKLLLEKGADKSTRDSSGCTPLLLAKRRGHTAIIQLLQSNLYS